MSTVMIMILKGKLSKYINRSVQEKGDIKNK